MGYAFTDTACSTLVCLHLSAPVAISHPALILSSRQQQTEARQPRLFPPLWRHHLQSQSEAVYPLNLSYLRVFDPMLMPSLLN